MVIIGLWFLALIGLALASLYGLVSMILSRHFVPAFIVVISIFVLASGLEVIFLLVLRARVISYKKFWNTERQPSPKELVYVALGDSAAQGIGASTPNASYVKILAADMESRTGRRVRIINLSSSGAKIQDLINEQLPKLKGLHPDIMTIDIGSNDIAHDTSQADMIRGYETILHAVSPYKIVFANIPDFMWGTQQRNTTEINKTILNLCIQYNLELADLHKVTHQRMWSLNEFAADGFHPSNNGHRTWASSFVPGIETVLARSSI